MESTAFLALLAFLMIFLHGTKGLLTDEVNKLTPLTLKDISDLTPLDLAEITETLKIKRLLETGNMEELRKLKVISNGDARVNPNTDQQGSYVEMPAKKLTKRASRWQAELDYVIPDDCKKEAFDQTKRVSKGQPT